LSFFVAAFVKKWARSVFIFPGLILSILLLAPFLWGKFDHIALFSPLWGTAANVYFPLFPWVVYPLLGMVISQYFVNGGLDGKFLKFSFWIGAVCICLGVLLFDFFPIGDYHRSGLAIHLLIIGFVFVWLPLCRVILEKISLENRVVQTFFFWSENVTAIYCIQWVLFGWSMLLFDANQQNDYTAALIGFFVLIMTHWLVRIPKIQQLFSWL